MFICISFFLFIYLSLIYLFPVVKRLGLVSLTITLIWNCSLPPPGASCYTDYLRGGTSKGLTLEETLIFPLTS